MRLVPFVVLDAVVNARNLGAHQWALRALMVGGTGLTLVAALNAATGIGAWPFVVALAFAPWAATKPDSAGPALLIGALLVLWLIGVDNAESGWSLLAALGVLVVHASATYAAETPAGGHTSPRSHGRWAMHTSVVAVATAVVWALAQALNGVDAQGRVLVTAAALIGVALTAAVLTWRSAAVRAAR
jgi:hypothetical protein